MSINDVLGNAAGKAHKAQGESLSTFLASLTTSGVILGLGIITYLLLRFKFREDYYKQAHQIFDSKWKPDPLSVRMLFSRIPDPHLTHASGFDNYLFDRYLHTIMRVFILLALTITPILIPLNVIDGKNELGGVKGLDRLSFSNVSLSHTDRYWAHLVLAIFVIVSVCYILQQELQDYARLQSLRASKQDGYAESSLLLISRKRLSVKAIRRHFCNISGGVHSITINRNYSSLRAKLRQRDASIMRLEIAETNLILKANCQRKLLRKTEDEKDDDYRHPMPLWMKYLRQKDRRSTRLPAFTWLPSLPLIGPRVDAIYHFRAEVARHNLEIERDQRHPDKFPLMNSAFVQFNNRVITPLAALALKARIPPTWTLKHGTTADDMIWSNISISWWQQCIRTAIVYSLNVLLTLGFSFPVAIVGSLSQIVYLVNVIFWLRWVGALPSWLLAVIQGVLPPAILALITTMVPVVLRFLANAQGLYSRQDVENHVQLYYFAFLFVQVFLTVSLSAGITTIIGELEYTIEAIPTVLAQNLPKASNYFFSYLMMDVFTTSVITLVQANGLVCLFVLSPIFDKTARQKWRREQGIGLQKWGTFIPVFTNIACIGLIYSVIAPLILVFSIIYFGALWMLYRSYPPNLSDVDFYVRGLFYPTAIRQLLTGIYFMELCLAGLFFLVRDADGKATCTAQATIMIATTGFTALFHYALNHGNWVDWLRQRAQRGSKGKERRPSTAKPRIFQADAGEDEALTSACPVLWIPKDELGIADDEIYHMRRNHDSILISNDGASVNERGHLILAGPPPDSTQGNVAD